MSQQNGFWKSLGDSAKERVEIILSISTGILAVLTFVFDKLLTRNGNGGGSSGSRSNGGSSFSTSSLIPEDPVMLFGIYCILATVLGWSLIALCAVIVRSLPSSASYLGYVVAIVWVSILISWGGSLGAGRMIQDTPLSMIFSVLGLCLATAFAKANLKRLNHQFDIRARHNMVGFLALFVAVSIPLILLQQTVR